MFNTRRRLASLAAALALATLVGLAGLAVGGFSELPSAGYAPSAMGQGAGAPVASSVIGTVAGVIAGGDSGKTLTIGSHSSGISSVLGTSAVAPL
jgi:hypothetical protein